MEDVKITSSLQNKIDELALAYVLNHYDIKSMSVTKFMCAVDKAGKEIFEYSSKDKN